MHRYYVGSVGAAPEHGWALPTRLTRTSASAPATHSLRQRSPGHPRAHAELSQSALSSPDHLLSSLLFSLSPAPPFERTRETCPNSRAGKQNIRHKIFIKSKLTSSAPSSPSQLPLQQLQYGPQPPAGSKVVFPEPPLSSAAQDLPDGDLLPPATVFAHQPLK